MLSVQLWPCGVRAPFGVRHHAHHVASFIDDARYVFCGPVGIIFIVDFAILTAVAEKDPTIIV